MPHNGPYEPQRVRQCLDHMGDGNDGNMWNYAEYVQGAYDATLAEVALLKARLDGVLKLEPEPWGDHVRHTDDYWQGWAEGVEAAHEEAAAGSTTPRDPAR